MSRNFKVLGLALVAVMALTAVMASAASAATYTSNKPHTIITGSQTTVHVYKVNGGSGGIVCTTASFEGTAESEAASMQQIAPTYSGCADVLGRTVDIDNSSFTYIFNGATITISGSLTLTIKNSGGSPVCTNVIQAQTGVNGIAYKNLGGTSGVEVIAASSNIISITMGGLLGCGVANGLHEHGTYEGNTVVTGKGTDGLAATISVD